MLPIAFSLDRLPFPWQRNLGHNWLSLALCKRYLRDFCVHMEVFGNGPANAANRILPRLTLVAMETKFGTKWAITGHIDTILPEGRITNIFKQHYVRGVSEILASNKGF